MLYHVQSVPPDILSTQITISELIIMHHTLSYISEFVVLA